MEYYTSWVISPDTPAVRISVYVAITEEFLRQPRKGEGMQNMKAEEASHGVCSDKALTSFLIPLGAWVQVVSTGDQELGFLIFPALLGFGAFRKLLPEAQGQVLTELGADTA